jgi:hypothetical protein
MFYKNFIFSVLSTSVVTYSIYIDTTELMKDYFKELTLNSLKS